MYHNGGNVCQLIKLTVVTQTTFTVELDGHYFRTVAGRTYVTDITEATRTSDIDFLLFTGYLKPAGEVNEDDDYQLRMIIPNREVKTIYRRSIRQWFRERTKAVSREALIKAVVTEDVDTFNRIVDTWLRETISFFDEKEQYYHGFLAGLLSGYDDYKVKSNRETGDGRTDILLMERFERNVAVVIEVKDVDTKKSETLAQMADVALKQIEEKHYADEPMNEGYQKIIKYGAAFQGKKCLIKLG